MDRMEFEELERGDIVIHRGNWVSYVIVGKTPEGNPIGIRQVNLSNPSEWEKVRVNDNKERD